jgi:hypothetical protein
MYNGQVRFSSHLLVAEKSLEEKWTFSIECKLLKPMMGEDKKNYSWSGKQHI